MKSEKKSDYFPALTGIRAVAAYLVYLHHTNPFSAERLGAFLHHFVDQFHIGVSIFFVLSGFLITLRYYQRSATTIPWVSYFKNRIARVFPMYFILTTLTLLFLFAQNRQGENPFFIYLMNISFLRGFFDDFKFTLIAQGWSLTVEECFYLSAPLLFVAFRKSKWLLFVIAVGFILTGCLLVMMFRESNFYGFFNSYAFLFTYTFPGRCVEFFWGAALVIYFKDHLEKKKATLYFTTFGISIVLVLLTFIALLPSISESTLSNPTRIIINNFILPGGIAMFFYGLMTEESYLKTMLGSKLFVTLGKSSYTFYLIHVGIIYSQISLHLSSDFLLIFLFLNVIALALWYFIEEPLNVWIRKF